MTGAATRPATTQPAASRQVIARGPEHPVLGQVSTRAVDARLAGAISAGSRPKDPPSHEPNEDGFLLRRDGDRVALPLPRGRQPRAVQVIRPFSSAYGTPALNFRSKDRARAYQDIQIFCDFTLPEEGLKGAGVLEIGKRLQGPGVADLI